jgi:hypothetical protein
MGLAAVAVEYELTLSDITISLLASRLALASQVAK